jgi:hypothetical protein
MRELQLDDLNVELLRRLGISDREMRFVQVHATNLHPLYQPACLSCFYRAELDVVLVEIASIATSHSH